jgi:hypothetical protein
MALTGGAMAQGASHTFDGFRLDPPPVCWPDNSWSHLLSTIQKFACGRGYLRAADVSSCCTLADGVVVQMIYCTNNGRILLANSKVPKFVYPICHLGRQKSLGNLRKKKYG